MCCPLRLIVRALCLFGVCSFDCIVFEAVYRNWPTLDHHRIVAALHAAQITNCSCYQDVTMSDAGDTITCDLCGKVWDMTNRIHKVAYDWHLPGLHALAAPKIPGHGGGHRQADGVAEQVRRVRCGHRADAAHRPADER